VSVKPAYFVLENRSMVVSFGALKLCE
jgi:hypothetical protein